MKHLIWITVGILISMISLRTQAETLQEAIRYATETNPNVLLAISNRHASDQVLRVAEADFLPSIDFTGAIGPQRNLNPFTTNLPNGPYINLQMQQAKATLTENVFEGFKTWNSVEKNIALVDSSAYKVSASAQDIALKVAQAYLDVLRRQRLLALAAHNLKIHERTYDMIKMRREGGLSDEADLEQAIARLASAHANYISEKGNLDASKLFYLAVIGHMPKDLSFPLLHEAYLPETEEELVDLSLQYNPEIRSAIEDVTAAEKEHKIAMAPNYPVINFELSRSHDRNLGGIAGVYKEDSALLRGNYNFYHGGADLAHQRETAFLVLSAQQTKLKLDREVSLAAGQYWINYIVSHEQIPYLKKHKIAARKTTILYRKQFQLGVRTLLDLLDSENEHYSASIAYVNAIFLEQFSKYQMLNSTGTLLEAMKTPMPIAARVI